MPSDELVYIVLTCEIFWLFLYRHHLLRRYSYDTSHFKTYTIYPSFTQLQPMDYSLLEELRQYNSHIYIDL